MNAPHFTFDEVDVYLRKTGETPETIVSDGKANFGTFLKVPRTLDIKGMKSPFGGIPLPTLITNFRIKGRIAYMFSIGDYIGMVEFFDDKLFGLAEIVFWYRSTGKRFAYHAFMPSRKRFIPIRLDEGVCASYRKTRFIRLFWSRKKDRISLVFQLGGDKTRPDMSGRLVAHFTSASHAECAVVTPAPSTYRCSASWLSAMRIRGSISVAQGKGGAIPMETTSGLAFMAMNRSYYRYRSWGEMMCGLGEHEGRGLLFRFVSTSADAVNSNEYNENVAVCDGRLTPMPAVTITHPFGINKQWVVQDTEAMVDLTFTPVSINKRALNILLMRTDYSNIYGTFDGALLMGDGEKLFIKDFPGIVKTNLLRV